MEDVKKEGNPESVPRKEGPPDGRIKFNFRTLIFILLAFVIARSCLETKDLSEITYNQFQQHLKNGDIKELTISGQVVSGAFAKPVEGKTKFQTMLVDKELSEELDQYGVSYRRVPDTGSLGSFLSVILPFLLFAAFWWFIIRKTFSMGKGGFGGGAGLMSIGKSRAKIYVEEKTKVTFKDVAGADEALEELREVTDFLKNSDRFKQIGGKMPKGVLLVGPPGTGKTLIAKAVAGEAGVPFYSTNGAEFVEMFVGVGAARVRDLFSEAKKNAPCIIFIDELDALGKARHVSPTTGNDEKEQTLNQLLVEMDGFDTKTGVIILAATNRPEIIDPALLRAGRFDRQVLVDRPDRIGRQDILKIHVAKVKLSPEVDLEHVASLTPGFSGADLANLVNEAALLATRGGAQMIEQEHFNEALERMVAGLQKKNRLLNPFERKVVAHHEMGHALVGRIFNHDDEVHKVSIIPRGIGSLGYTIQRPTEDRYLMTREELKNKMAVLLGGRVAEEIIFGHLSTGAADDIGKVTNIAREMVTRYGMSEELGHVAYDDSPQNMLNVKELSMRPNYSEDTAREIDANVRKLVGEAHDRALEFLRANRTLLEESAEELMRRETLNTQDLGKIFERIVLPQGMDPFLAPEPDSAHLS